MVPARAPISRNVALNSASTSGRTSPPPISTLRFSSLIIFSAAVSPDVDASGAEVDPIGGCSVSTSMSWFP
ncbi:hypothetical protein BT69DRAFT_697095 [Atractiella rhizophila]|nr:hypothetical protein BT69DRAFT_697095 [Atractiella rhizophila]